MPITLTVSEDLLTPNEEMRVLEALADALLETEGLTGNPFMVANVVGRIDVVPHGRFLAGGSVAAAALVELKLPGIALSTSDALQRFIARATEVVIQAAEGRLARDRIWINVVRVADGAWGIAGRGYDNVSLPQAIRATAAR
ncbi:Tautomerase enzyme [Burkholderia gladioli]|uniref:Tautomerase enzyme n=1 Tax=Burkholderia gladioli TaxID=28095 RepID=UPI000F7FEEB9|nr:Tautomerase enzyme [Burkholderia gladioli]